jgi:succinyl-diaminopimelate desuccinylase
MIGKEPPGPILRDHAGVADNVTHVLDLSLDGPYLLAQLVDVPSVSGGEGPLADAVEAAARALGHLKVDRDGNTVVARTRLGRRQRVVIAGHLDTVPEAGNLPSKVVADRLYGLGAVDMKGGVAVALRLAATVPQPTRDVTYVWYDCEEVEAVRNGLGRVSRTHPDWLAADFAVLMEPTNALVEAGCQGTLRVEITVHGERAHTARAWMGSNAIHAAAEVLDRLRSYRPRRPWVDGLTYREGLSAVAISGGVAGNVVPDACVVTVNYRFAPDRSEQQARDHVREVFGGYDLRLVDSSPGALPGLDRPAAAAFVAAIGATVNPKYGWTDVSRFAELGVPAVNYGPGDPSLAHTPGEHVELAQVRECEARLRAWLTS